MARFEREVTGERVRDKIAASKCKGMWMGGLVPLGYEVRERQLAVVESEAATVRLIFQRCCDLGGVRLLKQELDRDGFCSKLRIASNGSGTGEKSFSRGAPYTLLRNPTYVGEVRHEGARYPGQHQPIIERSMWDKTQELLRAHTVRAAGSPANRCPVRSSANSEMLLGTSEVTAPKVRQYPLTDDTVTVVPPNNSKFQSEAKPSRSEKLIVNLH